MENWSRGSLPGVPGSVAGQPLTANTTKIASFLGLTSACSGVPADGMPVVLEPKKKKDRMRAN